MDSRRKGRVLALQALYAREAGASPEESMLFDWGRNEDEEPEPESMLFAAALVSGAMENASAVDAAISSSLKNWTLNRVGKVDLAILRMAGYSLLFQRDIPVPVVINEAIELARSFGSANSYKFVNGVLNAVAGKVVS